MVSKTNILTKLKMQTLEMTESEILIADYILNNPEEIYNLKIENLSKKLKVSLPTVFRFAKKLGFEGFKDFKVALIREMAIGMSIAVDNISEDSIESTTRDIFNKISDNLKETLSLINFDDMSEAVDMIISAKKIIFFGVSYSASVALDAYLKFLSAGFNCQYDTDTYTQRIISTQATEKDLAIGISFSGASLEVVDCMRNARKNKSKTISITAFSKSPITVYSDLCLYSAPINSRYQRIDLPSKISFTTILDSLYINTVLRKRSSALNYISRTEEELSRYNRAYKDLKNINNRDQWD